MTKTICAIATPPGQGGIAVIRISGSDSLKIADTVFSKNVYAFKTHTAHYGHIQNPDGELIDHVLLLPMLAPKSYTGEDVIEIHCHGGLMAQKVLKTILNAGAHPAGPGEFTFRAYINGKMDLCQAEAVQALIGAKNTAALQAANTQLEGALSQKIQAFQAQLADTAAILEAWVDFPEEGLEFASLEETIRHLEETKQQMEKLECTFADGKIISEGINLCLIGAPNVGKSSLMNLLLGHERAIVTHLPGTTRDTLEDDLQIGNLHFRITDTAGIRKTDEIIEKQGIIRSQKSLSLADLILLVLDTTRELTDEERQLLKTLDPQKTILMWNKIDIAPVTSTLDTFSYQTQISAKTGQGLDNLKSLIEKAVLKTGELSKDQVLLTEERHYQALKRSIQALSDLISGLNSNISAEFLSSDMRACLLELSSICGTDVTEDILTAIFSKFCVGK